MIRPKHNRQTRYSLTILLVLGLLNPQGPVLAVTTATSHSQRLGSSGRCLEIPYFTGTLKGDHELAPFSRHKRSADVPVAIVFSAHGTAADAQWTGTQIRRFLKHDELRTAVIWIEHANPVGLPQTIRELEDRLGDRHRPEWNWIEQFSSDRLSLDASRALRAIFDQAKQEEGDSLRYFFDSEDSFSKGLREEIKSLNNRGYSVQVKIEEASFKSYLDFLRRDAMSLLASYWASRRDEKKSLASLAFGYRWFSESLEDRDQTLAFAIRRECLKNPNAIHIVCRGLAHIGTLSRSLTSQGLSHRYVVQADAADRMASDLRRYVLRYHELPSFENPSGRFLIFRRWTEIMKAAAV
ncbi:MAG: hypothetical protein NC930_07180 [Candidatus Omnitrophica bacterium]|nr:hypothetical protein [Candidatus Omnitrophota bacterium]